MDFPKLRSLVEAKQKKDSAAEYTLAEAMAEAALSKKEVLAALKEMSAKDRKAVCDKLMKMVEADEAGK
jgi:hypothetical protein